jgi:sialidase-1
MRTSSDRGRSWSAARTIRSTPDGGVGDPALLLDRRTGRVWCFHAFAALPSGAKRNLQCHAIYSDDHGANWSAPVDLTPQLKDPSWDDLFATSGTHFQTRSGRYLVPMVVWDAAKVMSSRNAYSDDSGVTWRVGAALGPGTDESKAVELSDGTILQNMRYNGASRRRAIAKSHDRGITFEPLHLDDALIDPVCNAGLFRHRGSGALVFTNAASTARRENLTVRLSFDEGKTWPRSQTLHPGPSAYSTAIGLSDGTIAVLYECGVKHSTERISFARFSLRFVS